MCLAASSIVHSATIASFFRYSASRRPPWAGRPLAWIRDNNAMFLEDMTADEGQALATIARLKASRLDYEAQHGPQS